MVDAFVEVQFPPEIGYGSSGGPIFSTDVTEGLSGAEVRNSNWSQARARYNVAPGVKTAAQADALIAFFRARRGRAQGFRFKDWSDCSATAQVIGTGNGARTQFQLSKRYQSGGVEVVRPILKPVVGTLQLQVNGAAVAGTAYALDATTGVVTFTYPPANGASVAASFEFDVPVRFDTDALEVVLQDYGVRALADLPLVELRLTPATLTA